MESGRELEIVAEVAIAMVLGGALGSDRLVPGRSAGLRTHMLVAGAATLLVGLGFSLIENALVSRAVVAVDPVRIIQAIVIGVCFIGAGMIVRDGGARTTEGLTTAASLLMSSGIGIAVALRQFTLAVGAAILVAVVLRFAGRFENHEEPKR